MLDSKRQLSSSSTTSLQTTNNYELQTSVVVRQLKTTKLSVNKSKSKEKRINHPCSSIHQINVSSLIVALILTMRFQII